MTSNDLPELSEWIDWSEHAVASAPKAPGVYVLRLASGTQSVGRLKGSSDLIYVGRAKNLRSRLTRHFGAHYLSDKVEKEVGRLEVAWKQFDTDNSAADQEAELLDKYKEDHLELPPLNHQHTGRGVRAAVHLLEALPSDERVEVIEKLRKTLSSVEPTG